MLFTRLRRSKEVGYFIKNLRLMQKFLTFQMTKACRMLSVAPERAIIFSLPERRQMRQRSQVLRFDTGMIGVTLKLARITILTIAVLNLLIFFFNIMRILIWLLTVASHTHKS